MLLKSQCTQWDLKNKFVFLRVDLNIDSPDETIKFKKIIPTLELLHNAGACTIIGTHRGRPYGYDARQSTGQLLPLFENAQLPIGLIEGVHDFTQKYSNLASGSFLLLENLRFFRQPNRLISLLQESCEFYINDSWGSAHRKDPFIDQLAPSFATEKRSVGILIEQEMRHLTPLREAHGPSFTALIGGSKYPEKLTAIELLIPRAGHIFVGPAQSFAFHCAQNKNTHYFAQTGACAQEHVTQAHRIFKQAERLGNKLIIPTDYAVEDEGKKGTQTYMPIEQLEGLWKIIGPGLQSMYELTQIIQKSHTVLYAGFMGFVDNEQSMNANKLLFDILAKAHGTTVIAGGQTAHAAHLLGYENTFSWISTGGGATLAYVCKQPMPGLLPFL